MTAKDKRKAAARRAAVKRSCVGSIADRHRLGALKRECKERRKAGEDVRMGHIIPLRHPLVCGLTNIHNMRIMTAAEDDAMGNNFTPYIGVERRK